ncbi:NADPH-dependent glutamate synthase beta subunit-like oxidoreductase [Mobilisporobacter senegalensis]|uniref:NADPH-dependent glutamate synthase beta subunit-like oxidoreductase n=1 Tax=Mobilisporobacter senegalensis TaxID=1329262 RepID=A0A3N1XKD2_9FIRM|nr:FAD-dependent oxidoreductase [Mobilisporobacter senegalensis]ROR27179.1 NADPH-dependent glutamate synthase beta subunit-like oxidoreductase [Mobilisporobacter senegalensis]
MVKTKVLELANHISRKKMGSKNGITEKDPEYMILEPVVTEEMAEVVLCMEIRKKTTAKELAPLCGKSLEKTEELLWKLADAGVCFVNEIDGVDTYWYDTWVPGIMEMMVNHKENVKKFPQIAEAFEAYGRVRGPRTTGAFPVGVGLMRVIPIEKAIDGETRRASYEEVSKYLNDNNIFSVSDCSCRTAREAMGEGCGHLKEDMCIQMGHAAEYYIRTGRGRQITREEAFEIIRKAEENGLMHQIPNLDGSGKTHAICNCCGCSCLALRTAEMFKNVDMVRSNYVSHVDKDKCVACGECVETCPVNALQLGQKLCTVTPLPKKKIETPRDMEWGPEKWNPDYRINRKDVVDSGTSPCKTECPAHIAIQGYIKLASQGRYTEALELIKHENPFPAVCGRVCPRKCESACTRGDIDSPIAIDEIKKFIAEQDLNKEERYIPEKRHEYGNKIAVIGAGPAGLSCAYYLSIDGYNVTVFEKEEVLGGMLTLGIPSFRLEKNIVNAEIDILRELGVKFKTGIEVGKNITLNDLRDQGYEAFYLAIGAKAGRKLGIEGEDADGVITGIDFLRNVNLGKINEFKGKTVVIGGGNVAIDVARTAMRLGENNVSMYCLESREQMPALEEEIEEAMAENIVIHNSWGPKRILVKDGRITAVELKKCLSAFDENGRFYPIYDEDNTIIAEADNIVISIGQAIDYGNLILDSKIELNPNNTVKADPFTYQTNEPDVFTGGDVYTGPRFAIDAIAAGKQGAISIHRYVQPGQSLIIGRDRREYQSLDKQNLDFEGYDSLPRQSMGHVDGSRSKETFKDLRGTFTMEQVMEETKRCLSCGATVVDEFLCVGCGACTMKCKFDAISLIRKYDGEGVAFENLKPVVLKHIIKRKGKIAVKKAVNIFQRD